MTAPLVFITGASSGIGQALAARYLRAGWRLALVARRTHEIKSWAEANGISACSYEIYSADVAQPDSIAAAGQDCLQRQGVPDARPLTVPVAAPQRQRWLRRRTRRRMR